MASDFKVGDLVWAKLKGFQAWPGKIVEAKENIKKPGSKKNMKFVYFYGSENYAWIPEDNIYNYAEYKSKYVGSSRIPKGLKEALEAIDSEHQAKLVQVCGSLEDLPSIDEEVALMQKSKTSDSDGGDTSSQTKSKKAVKKPKAVKEAKAMPQPKAKQKSPAPKGSGRIKRPAANSSPSETPPSKKFFISKGRKSLSPETASKGDESASKGDESTHKLGTSILPGSPKLAENSMVGQEETEENHPVIPTPLRIGFLGLGIMGQGIVMNLLRSGHEVTVWNRTATKCREFVKAGALKGNNPADVVQSCDVTFTCVADSTAVRDIMFGNMGVLDGISNGKSYVEMSTVDEETVQDVADAVMARGGAFLEAQVCGSRVSALEGQLLILCSGDRKLFEDLYSCFQAIGKKSFYLSNEVGSATRMNLIHSMILGNMVASVAEGMALAEKVNIDLRDFTEVLSLGSLSCRTINNKTQAILNGHFDPHFPLLHQQKDLRLVLGLGDSVEQPLYLAAAANELFKKARRMGYGEMDEAAVSKAASDVGETRRADNSRKDQDRFK